MQIIWGYTQFICCFSNNADGFTYPLQLSADSVLSMTDANLPTSTPAFPCLLQRLPVVETAHPNPQGSLQ